MWYSERYYENLNTKNFHHTSLSLLSKIKLWRGAFIRSSHYCYLVSLKAIKPWCILHKFSWSHLNYIYMNLYIWIMKKIIRLNIVSGRITGPVQISPWPPPLIEMGSYLTPPPAPSPNFRRRCIVFCGIRWYYMR